MPVTSVSESIISVILVTSALFPSSLSYSVFSVSFHLYRKIHFERFISITYFILPGIQLNFLRSGSKTQLSRLIEKCLLMSCWCKNLRKACFFFNLSSATLVSFHRATWVEIPLGKHWDDRSTWTCNSSDIFRLQNRISRHPQILLFWIYFKALHPAQCLSAAEKCLGHITAPQSLLPAVWYTHFLLVSSGTSRFSL